MNINYYGISSSIQADFNNPKTLDQILDMLEQGLIERKPHNIFAGTYMVLLNPFKFSERYFPMELELHEAEKRSAFLRRFNENLGESKVCLYYGPMITII